MWWRKRLFKRIRSLSEGTIPWINVRSRSRLSGRVLISAKVGRPKCTELRMQEVGARWQPSRAPGCRSRHTFAWWNWKGLCHPAVPWLSMIKGSHTWTSRFSTCSGLLLLSTDAVFQPTYTLVRTHTYVCKYILVKSHRWPPLPERFGSASVDAHVYAYTFVYSVVYMHDDDCFYYHTKYFSTLDSGSMRSNLF